MKRKDYRKPAMRVFKMPQTINLLQMSQVQGKSVGVSNYKVDTYDEE